ncbi:hypothetical protein EMA8858_00547 [Emticicia aquatica]|uniref:Outer membrane protein beta-barrel domain-containing protein n=1 Tax=Emticicia aquatica TaxID=1681835 RepID=A0ABN8ENJ1_9BACT|nr:hypothetical protein [Emticicia aquatica]CAH0994437.1 hypothetical protein EMA8858_00547 [Emticicia aquatica]
MRRFLIVFFFTNLLVIRVLAQDKTPKYLEDQYSWYLSLNLGNALGKYHDILKESEKAGIKGGIVIGGLMNPYKRKHPSTVFYGAEFGYQSEGRDGVTLTNAEGDFYVSNNAFWLNGLARYRPVLWSSKFNPYADAFFGAKLIKTSVVEQLGQDETQVLDGIARIVPNYGLGVGLGIKLFGQLKNNYLDIGVYYQQADATKIVKRNSVNINSDYRVSFKQVLTNTNQIVIKIGITGFL